LKVVFTKHATKKFTDLKLLGVFLSRKKIFSIIDKPLRTDKSSDYPNVIACGELDQTHVILVVYKIEDDIITIITFFPGRKRRYLK